MESVFVFEGGSADYRVVTTKTDLEDELVSSLTSFVQVYSRHKDHLQRRSESFILAAAGLHEVHEDAVEHKAVRGLFAVFGGVLGAASGGVTGGVLGAIGAVSVATFLRLCGDIDAVGAAVGFFGSVFGGVVGGAFGGTVAEATGSPVYAVVSEVAWFTLGLATGGAIGGIFGGMIGAGGGAVGGAFGALYGMRFAVSVRSAAHNFCGSKDSKEQKTKSKKANVMQKTGDFRKAVKLLVEELKTIKTFSDKMASSASVHSVAGQTARTLASVSAMEETISDSQEAADLPQFVSSVEEAARQSKKVTEELETTRAAVEELLVSLRKPNV